MDSSIKPGTSADQSCCPIVELRQYTLHPGKRDILIDLFDREFVESQEAVGIKVIGQFRDLDNPNRFVWLRGFRDMPLRAQALSEFYGGPVWKMHREAANATMIDSDNVLLLRPIHANSGFTFAGSRRAPPGVDREINGLIVATIYYFDAPVNEEFVDFFNRVLRPALTHTGGSILACLVTESAVNNFPKLPVREGENVFVWFSRFPDVAAYEGSIVSLDQAPFPSGTISKELTRLLKGRPEILKLLPTARSQLTA
jgi:hypothetical protein